MRCAVALSTCLSLVPAFLLAPFQHVHEHEHSTTVHAHFYTARPSTAPGITDDDDDHDIAQSVDTFTLVLTAGFAPFVPSVGPALLFVPSKTFEPVAVVEERGHDPPCIACRIPRAPPS
jgi:hypothetical protein